MAREKSYAQFALKKFQVGVALAKDSADLFGRFKLDLFRYPSGRPSVLSPEPIAIWRCLAG